MAEAAFVTATQATFVQAAMVKAGFVQTAGRGQRTFVQAARKRARFGAGATGAHAPFTCYASK